MLFQPKKRPSMEEEIASWQGFERALRLPEKEAFDEIIAAARRYAWAADKAPFPVMFEPFAFSILLMQQKRIRKLEQKLEEKLAKKEQTEQTKPAELAQKQENNNK